MKTITRSYYKCEICGHEYETEKEAVDCESKPVSKDKKVKKGDLVLITGGDGTGEQAKVKTIFVIDKYWGHHAWKTYWHTIAVTADLTASWGTRLLTFDQYEPIDVNSF